MLLTVHRKSLSYKLIPIEGDGTRKNKHVPDSTYEQNTEQPVETSRAERSANFFEVMFFEEEYQKAESCQWTKKSFGQGERKEDAAREYEGTKYHTERETQSPESVDFRAQVAEPGE